MDMDRATVKAATATDVRPRFCLMLPAAIFPAMPPRVWRNFFKGGAKKEEGKTCEKTHAEKETKSPCKTDVYMQPGEEEKEYAHKDDHDPCNSRCPGLLPTQAYRRPAVKGLYELETLQFEKRKETTGQAGR